MGSRSAVFRRHESSVAAPESSLQGRWSLSPHRGIPRNRPSCSRTSLVQARPRGETDWPYPSASKGPHEPQPVGVHGDKGEVLGNAVTSTLLRNNGNGCEVMSSPSHTVIKQGPYKLQRTLKMRFTCATRLGVWAS